jgi:hypothetical protein
MAEAVREKKVVRSYTLVFRRRWRIFRLQRWRIPLPGGLELRLVGYWLACLAAMAILTRLPGIGRVVGVLPASVRLLVVPLIAAWGLSRWEVDGRAPHRALIGAVVWWVRPRVIASFRRVPPVETVEVPVTEVALAPDLAGSSYPRGVVRGPAEMLLRYPVEARRPRRPRLRGRATSRSLRLRGASPVPMQRGRTLQVPVGGEVRFE